MSTSSFNLRRVAQEAMDVELNRILEYTEVLPPEDGATGCQEHQTPVTSTDCLYTPEAIQFMAEKCIPIPIPRRLNSGSVSSCGYYGGCRDESLDLYGKTRLPLRKLVKRYNKLGYTYISWDGVTARPLLDWDGRIFAVLAGRPTDELYAKACDEALNAINAEGQCARFQQEHLVHKRGRFPAVNTGVTHGIGTTRPVNLQNDQLNDAMRRLLSNPGMKRISAFQNAAFALWAPKLYSYYDHKLSKIWQGNPSLTPGFDNSVWPCTAINFGPKAYTAPHRNCKNLSFGWCSIASLGSFNPQKGGHLVLPDLRLIIEFPAGSNILIPSALLTHCNTAVGSDEECVSFTQFCAGELFRFADCGLMTETALKRSDPACYEELVRKKKNRWTEGLNLYQIFEKGNIC